MRSSEGLGESLKGSVYFLAQLTLMGRCMGLQEKQTLVLCELTVLQAEHVWPCKN